MAVKNNLKKDFSILITGTGFSGICVGIQLKKAGIHNFKILEKANDVGGTWRDNTYPGAACDVKSNLYSFSFEPNPNWSREFSAQKEILDYIRHCVKKYDLEKHIVFNWEVATSIFHEDKAMWEVINTRKEKLFANVIVPGNGPLHIPSLPDIDGIRDFKGEVFHSAKWNHDYDLDGKNVCVIGTGASAIQFVPEIQPKAKNLYLMQRTAPWVLPKPDGEFTSLQHTLFEKIPFVQKLNRDFIYYFNEAQVVGFMYEDRILKLGEAIGTRYMKKIIKDPTLRKKLTPTYRLGCKRVLMSNNYYQSLAKPNVDVVTDGIVKFTKDAVITGDGKQRKIDALILGTGFHVADSFLFYDVHGRDDVQMKNAFKDGPQAYYGSAIHGFPNMFMMLGPNTGLGHNSMVYMIESQTNYVVDAIQKMMANNIRTVEVKEEVQEKFNEEIQRKLINTIWDSGCKSWYLSANGKNHTVWPGFTTEFRKRTKTFNMNDYIVEKEIVKKREAELV
ncbi:MAG: NAD(P)/FAD-dependent oxidoreductase [Bacteroidota bacterium]|nr:NAD(P)/FAD-dependent oxidoreductase [Bacteroidota bacterium]